MRHAPLVHENVQAILAVAGKNANAAMAVSAQVTALALKTVVMLILEKLLKAAAGLRAIGAQAERGHDA